MTWPAECSGFCSPAQGIHALLVHSSAPTVEEFRSYAVGFDFAACGNLTHASLSPDTWFTVLEVEPAEAPPESLADGTTGWPYLWIVRLWPTYEQASA